MKKTGFMAAVSLVALMAAGQAVAQETPANTSPNTTQTQRAPANNPDTPDTGTVTEGELREGWENTKDAAVDTYDKLKAAVLDENAGDIDIDKRTTANALIGKPVYDPQQKKIATVEDIILDQDGMAKLVVVQDLGFLGFGGKLAAFDYNTVITTDASGALTTSLNEQDIKNAAPFSYDETSGDTATRMVPDNDLSVMQLLDGKLRGVNGEEVAEIEDVAFSNDRASFVVASYDEVLNMGGKKVALGFDGTQLQRENDRVDLKLDMQETQAFQRLQQAADAE